MKNNSDVSPQQAINKLKAAKKIVHMSGKRKEELKNVLLDKLEYEKKEEGKVMIEQEALNLL